MWDILATAAWVVSAAIFLWMAWDFFVVNAKYDENVLVSSRRAWMSSSQPVINPQQRRNSHGRHNRCDD